MIGENMNEKFQMKDRMNLVNKISLIKNKVENPELYRTLDDIKNKILFNKINETNDINVLLNIPADVDIRGKPKNTDYVKKKWEEFLERNENSFLSLYIHIPFCLGGRCKFCREYSTILENKIELDKYLKYLAEEMNYLAPLFSKKVFSTLYVGGGTPSIFSSEQLEFLFGQVFKNFKIDLTKECTIEMSPETTTEEKIDVVKKYGFNRISLGIQSLDKKVLMINNRERIPYNKLKKLFEYIKTKHFTVFTTDLMVGLTGDTSKTFLTSLEKLIKLGSDAIVFGRLVKSPIDRASLIKEKYPNQKGNTNIIPDYKSADYSFPELYMEGEILLKKYNYNKAIGGLDTSGADTHFFKEGVNPFYPIYTVRNKKNDNSVLGIGIGAASKISYELEYANITNLKSDYSFDFTCYYVYERTVREQMIHYLIGSLIAEFENSQISISDFKKKFKRDIFEEFKEELDILKWMGMLVINNDRIILFPKNDYEKVFATRIFA